MCILALFLLVCTGVFAESLPPWFVPLRDAVYEQQLKADEVTPLYREVTDTARQELTGAPLYVMLSRCEYMMGRVYQFDERKDEAAARYSEGISWAERAIEIQETDEAWRMLAENISQSCVVRSTAYAMANGLKVERYSKNALALNGRNAAAQYMVAARWVFAPAPFHNYRRGIEMMNAIFTEGDMEKDDLYNVYSAIGYAYVQQKRYADARPWLLRALEMYPTNKYAQSLLARS
ncbi:MAG: tetratricopeptide repeat protein [Treponema sp.]|nr:tetratricopeptide repeat protein [Treponema sp.]